MMLRLVVFLSFLIEAAICDPSIEILRTNRSASCRNFNILEGNIQSVTFQVTGDWGDSNLDVFNSPYLRYTNDSSICALVNFEDKCTSQYYNQHTCACENLTGGVYHLTYTGSTKNPLVSYEVVLTWQYGLKAVRSDSFVLKEVREKRNCWVPTIEILKTEESASCSNDYLAMGRDYQLVTFNLSWSNSDYTLDSLGTPVVVNSSSSQTLCPLIGQDNKCLPRTFEGYSCLCEEITPDEYHLTFKHTPTQPGNGFPIHMMWVGQNKADDITSDAFTLKEVKNYSKKDCGEENLSKVLLAVGIAIGALIFLVSGALCYKLGLPLRTTPVDNSTEAERNRGTPTGEIPEREKSMSTARKSDVDTTEATSVQKLKVKVTGSAVDAIPSTEI